MALVIVFIGLVLASLFGIGAARYLGQGMVDSTTVDVVFLSIIVTSLVLAVVWELYSCYRQYQKVLGRARQSYQSQESVGSIYAEPAI